MARFITTIAIAAALTIGAANTARKFFAGKHAPVAMTDKNACAPGHVFRCDPQHSSCGCTPG